jgi:carbamate kinase
MIKPDFRAVVTGGNGPQVKVKDVPALAASHSVLTRLPIGRMTTKVEGHEVSKETAEKYRNVRDQEVEKPQGAPRPVLIIVMVSPTDAYMGSHADI